MRILGATFQFGTPATRSLLLDTALRDMGMELLKPPSVFGWKLNDGFVTGQAMLKRYNFADTLVVTGNSRLPADTGGLLPILIVGQSIKSSAKKTLAFCQASFAQLELGAETTAKFRTLLLTDFLGLQTDWDPHNSGFLCLTRVFETYRLTMCLPEFHLN
jgi:hypothetical protein